MPSSKLWRKDPDAAVDFQWDWTTWLDGDTISTATFTVPDGLTKDSETNTDSDATVWLSGGTAGVTYEVTCQITTAAGRTDERTASIWCYER